MALVASDVEHKDELWRRLDYSNATFSMWPGVVVSECDSAPGATNLLRWPKCVVARVASTRCRCFWLIVTTPGAILSSRRSAGHGPHPEAKVPIDQRFLPQLRATAIVGVMIMVGEELSPNVAVVKPEHSVSQMPHVWKGVVQRGLRVSRAAIAVIGRAAGNV